MSERIPGKRYRVTVEGVATEGGGLRSNGNLVLTASDFESFGFTTELLPDPLPTTPGSVIRADDTIYMRRGQLRTDYPWVDLDGDIVSDSEVVGAIVLFDAGKA